MFKKLAADYFSFSKKERRGIIAICITIVVLAFLPLLFPFFIQQKKTDAEAFKKEIALLQLKQVDSANNFKRNYADENNYEPYQPYEKKEYKINGELFFFDPNSISTADWKCGGINSTGIIILIKKVVNLSGFLY